MPFKRIIEHTKKKPAGQAMVEFAIILTVMMGLFVGTFEIMVLYRKRTEVATATRMAARQASELWVESADENAFKDEIQLYVWNEMEKMGYDRDWMNNGTVADDSDDPVRVSIGAAELVPSGADLEFVVDNSTGTGLCTYGQYIEVRIEMDWTFAVLPLDTFFKNVANTSGIIEENALVRCWRGN